METRRREGYEREVGERWERHLGHGLLPLARTTGLRVG